MCSEAWDTFESQELRRLAERGSLAVSTSLRAAEEGRLLPRLEDTRWSNVQRVKLGKANVLALKVRVRQALWIKNSTLSMEHTGFLFDSSLTAEMTSGSHGRSEGRRETVEK